MTIRVAMFAVVSVTLSCCVQYQQAPMTTRNVDLTAWRRNRQPTFNAG